MLLRLRRLRLRSATDAPSQQRAFGACRLLAFSTLFVHFVADVPYCSAVFCILLCIVLDYQLDSDLLVSVLLVNKLSKRLKDCGLCFISTA